MWTGSRLLKRLRIRVIRVICGLSQLPQQPRQPLLPQPFAFLSSWLPSGSTVTAVRDAVYFRHYQHVHPVVVLAIWALVMFAAWLVIAGRAEERGNAVAPAAADGT